MKPEKFRGVFRDDELARAVYAEGAGIAREIPEAICVPADAADVQAIVTWAAKTGHSLIPRGSASGMAGGSVGRDVIVDLSRFKQVGEIDIDTRRVWVEPGVICQEVNDAAKTKGLRLPVDPSSAPFCTIGGMASTNAAGPRSLRFGPMRDWVQSLDCVFADGSRATLRRGSPAPDVGPLKTFLVEKESIRAVWAKARNDHRGVRKDSSGYAVGRFLESGDPIDLLVGSEGTLAIIVGVELRLAPLPGFTASLLAAFDSLDDASAAAIAARESGASACELLDQSFLELAASSPEATDELEEWATNSAAVLLVAIEGEDSVEAQKISAAVEQNFQKAGARTVQIATTLESQREVWELRHAASPILSRLKNLTSMQFIEDGAVPPEKLADYVRGVRRLLEKHSTSGVIFGHAGDAHVHVNPLIDMSRNSWRETIASLLDDVVALTAELGGTLTGEHGDGRLRTPLLSSVWSDEAREVFRTIKHCFDPTGVFNRGVKTQGRDTDGTVGIKYDPALPALPAAARRALDEIVSERRYSDFRLSLVD